MTGKKRLPALRRPKTADQALNLIREVVRQRTVGPWWRVSGRTKAGVRYESVNTDVVAPRTQSTRLLIGIICLTYQRTGRAKMVFIITRKRIGRDLWRERFEVGKSSPRWEEYRRFFDRYYRRAKDFRYSFLAGPYKSFIERLT